MKSVDWAVVSFVSTSQLLLFVMHTDTVSVFSEGSFAGVGQSGRDVLVFQTRQLKVLFSKPMPPRSLMRWKAEEYMHHCHNILLPQHVFDFFAFMPHTSTACTYAAIMLPAEPPIIAASFNPVSHIPASNAPDYHSVCASFLSVPEVIKWSYTNHNLPCSLDFAIGSHSVGGAHNILSNSPVQAAIHCTSASLVPSAVIFDASSECHSPMAGNLSAHVSGSLRFLF